MSERAPRYVPAITGTFWIAVAVAIIALWPAPDGLLYWVRGVVFALPFLFGLDSLRTALFASDEQVRLLVDGDPAAHQQQRLLGLAQTLIRLISSRRFVLLMIFAAVAAFFFIDQYVPQWGIAGNVLRGEIAISPACDYTAGAEWRESHARYDLMTPDERREYTALMTPEMRREFSRPEPAPTPPGCGSTVPYRWVALAAVLITGAHLILRAGRRV